jgi:hypothetical protein
MVNGPVTLQVQGANNGPSCSKGHASYENIVKQLAE